MKNLYYLCARNLNTPMQIPIESLNLLMLNVGLARHNADWNWKMVSSPFTRIFYVTEGSARIHLSSGTISLRPGYLYLIPAYTVHSYECDHLFTLYYLHVYEGFKQETDIFDIYDFNLEVKADENVESLFRQMCKQHPNARLPESNPVSYDNRTMFTDYVTRYNEMPLHEKMRIRGAILMLISQFLQYAQPRHWTQDPRLSRAQRFILDNIYCDIDVEELASVACMSKQHLIKLFSRNFGISPLQYINQKKIERAQLFLATSDEPIKQIAYNLGFNDYSYFIRLFRMKTGTTPLKYREQMSSPTPLVKIPTL